MINRLIRLSILVIICVPALVVKAQEKQPVIALWEKGAPGSEDRKNEPEQAKDWWVKNIHNPSVTVFLPPRGKANGAAVVVCPGGGHRELVFNPEGRDAATYLNSIGVTVFVLKYRLFREENSKYTIDNVREDVYRAMRLVRSRASEWNVDPDRIGIMGFSAGGEVSALVAYDSKRGDTNAPDPIDRTRSKPDFQILIYPGPYGVPETIPNDAPPVFLLTANDDACCSEPTVKLLQRYRAAGVPVEAHIYTQGSHGFNMGDRSKLNSIKTWPQRLGDWLSDNGYLVPKKK